uniref:Tetratricopeptide repeat protein n=1 Tax=viral metagenome TaxID=1070528 RepID=A0A6C0H4M9_9ZZZZ
MEKEFNKIMETNLIKMIKSENNIDDKYELAKYYALFEAHYEKGIKILTDLVYNIDLNRNWNDYFDQCLDYCFGYSGGFNSLNYKINIFMDCIINLGLIYYNYGLKENAVECWIYGIKKLRHKIDCEKIKWYVVRYYLINEEFDKLNEFSNENIYFKSNAKILLAKYFMDKCKIEHINNGKNLLDSINSEYCNHADLYEYLGIYNWELEKYGIGFNYLKKVENSPLYKYKNWKAFLYLGKYYEIIEENKENANKYYLMALNYITSFKSKYINEPFYLFDNKFSYDEEDIEIYIDLLDKLVTDYAKGKTYTKLLI